MNTAVSNSENGCSTTADGGLKMLLMLRDRAEVLVVRGLDAERKESFIVSSLCSAHPEPSQLLFQSVE